MKLQYRILWFDDNDDFFNSLDWDYLRGRVAEWGFEPAVKLVTTGEAFREESPFANYDLLVVDFNLEGIGEGQDFIRAVRDLEVLTEVIFYSSNPKRMLWDAVRKEELEGVYIASRDSVQDRVLKVGHQTLRKVLDLDNMRGIVMAEVGDLDLLLGRVIEKAMCDLEDSARRAIFSRFYEKSTAHHSGQRSKLDAFKESPTVQVMLSLCDSNKRWQNFRRVQKAHGSISEMVFGDYVQEVLNPRNCLAHGVPTRREDGALVFLHHGRVYEFSETIGASLRNKIIEYKKAFSVVETTIFGGPIQF